MPKRLHKTSRPASSPVAIPASLTDPDLPLPKLVVFDLDYTLWPFWIDTHVLPPLKANSAHTGGTDRRGEDFAFYADVPSILLALPALDVRLAVASRTTADQLAKELLKMIRLVPEGADEKAVGKRIAWDVFDAGLEMYNQSKKRHFRAIQARTGIAFEDMLFFDDEVRNFETEELGVTMQLVRDGVTWGEFEKGVAEWRKRRGHISTES